MECLRVKVECLGEREYERNMAGNALTETMTIGHYKITILYINTILLLTSILTISYAADINPQTSVIPHEYVTMGLKNNLSIIQAANRVELKDAQVSEARSRYFLSVGLSSRYTIAEGGRTSELPLGDLLNPVYANLNRQSLQQGGSAIYPQIDNKQFEINFLRSREQETKLSIVQPIFNLQILNGYIASKRFLDSEQDVLNIVKRDIILQIHKSYFRYFQALSVSSIYSVTHNQIKEQLRAAKVLSNAGSLTSDAVEAAEAELMNAYQNLIKSDNMSQNAKAAFNAVLNRPMDSEIELITEPLVGADIKEIDTATISNIVQEATRNREEIKMLEHNCLAVKKMADFHRSGYIPSLAASAEAGIQGTRYSFDKENRYVCGSILFTWNFFDGFGESSREKASRIEEKNLVKKIEEVKLQVGVQVQTAVLNFNTVLKSIDPAEKQFRAAQKRYDMVWKRYENGAATTTELSDAHSSLTRAELNLISIKYELLIANAEYQRATAHEPIPEIPENNRGNKK